jgi:hypothetical protein
MGDRTDTEKLQAALDQAIERRERVESDAEALLLKVELLEATVANVRSIARDLEDAGDQRQEKDLRRIVIEASKEIYAALSSAVTPEQRTRETDLTALLNGASEAADRAEAEADPAVDPVSSCLDLVQSVRCLVEATRIAATQQAGTPPEPVLFSARELCQERSADGVFMCSLQKDHYRRGKTHRFDRKPGSLPMVDR